MEAHDKIIAIIQQKGPVIPAQIAKELGINQLFSSAMLAELVDRKILKISHIKFGGSPLYFLPGQEDRLQEFYKNLPEKEQRAFLLLKEKKVLADPEIDPLSRFALRQIRDFAKPLQVSVEDGFVIFWKWYLLSGEEAEAIIKRKMGQEEKQQEEKPEPRKEAKPAETIARAERPAESERKPAKKQEKEKKENPSGDFLAKLTAYFQKNRISVLETDMIKKNTEIDFTLLLPSAVGNLKYYCKAKDKQRCSDADLSSAYVKGEMKKLPVLFLSTGEFTKKAKEMLSNEFKNITASKIE